MGERVSTLELFFDLVFVLIIGQLTAVLAHDPDLEHLARVAVVLAVVWWMYSGYAWLTNAVATEGLSRRLTLLAGMGGFFVLALLVPRTFDEGGVAFGIAYLLVVLVHVGLFSRSAGINDPSVLWRLGRWNLLTAVGLVVGGALDAGPQLAVWALVAVVQFGLIGYRTGDPASFAVRPAHFVERHGLVVIVAIGESVVVLGLGLAELDLDAGLVASALLGLALCAALWWTYFGAGDEEAAERALTEAPAPAGFRMALEAFGQGHLGLLLGIVLVAAGVEIVAHDPGHALDGGVALLLGGGAALYLVADALFRHRLGLGPSVVRLVAAAGAAGTALVGRAAGVAQVGALVAVFVAVFVVEGRTARFCPSPSPVEGDPG